MLFREWCVLRGKEYLLREWHTEKNGVLTPDTVTHNSGKLVWWRCEKGHEWQTQLKSRSTSSTRCPYCKSEQLRQRRKAKRASETPGKRSIESSPFKGGDR